jgi:hypothetical protein
MKIDIADLALKSGAVYTTEGNRILYIMSAEELQKFFDAICKLQRSWVALNESQILALWQESGHHMARFAKLIEYYHGGGDV